MSITFNIIRKALEHFNTETEIPESWNPSFDFCLPLSDENVPLMSNCLYVARLSVAMKITGSRDNVVIVCLRDRLTDDTEQGEAVRNCFIVNENITRLQLLTTVQDRFYSVLHWENTLKEALLNNCSIQELVDLCPPFLENHIQITDASFMKLAQSTKIDCDCPIVILLKKYGYHPQETVDRFREFNLFDVWASQDDIYVDNATDVAKYPTVHKIFKFHGSYYAHVVMTCSHSSPDPAMIDLFRIFTEALNILIERDWETRLSCVHPYDSVFLELLEGKNVSTVELQDRAMHTGLPMEGSFFLIQIVRADEQSYPLGTMMKEFGDLFPRFKFINFQDSIAAFVHSTSQSHETLNEYLEEIDSFLEKYNSYCGISSCFNDLLKARYYFMEAKLALKYSKLIRNQVPLFRLQEDICPKDSSRISWYDHYFPYSYFADDEETSSLWQHSYYHNLLQKLYISDQQRGTDDLHLLFVYLCHERKSTETAAILNMHRNSIIYRINRIEESLQIDLNDEHTRLMLLFSFVPLITYGFLKDQH